MHLKNFERNIGKLEAFVIEFIPLILSKSNYRSKLHRLVEEKSNVKSRAPGIWEKYMYTSQLDSFYFLRRG